MVRDFLGFVSVFKWQSPILAKGKNKLDVYQKLMVHPSGKFLEMIFQRILNNIEETTK
jgi:hypothetical protein